ncbi:hypothetical protein ACQP25_44415 (plasmid) [Microtetraspora malaysiensis]|uniref:hypothetical protein n=1 Tax=Microtetraspora malaysiensis TaxID=161358 RepID=UPI003D9004D5
MSDALLRMWRAIQQNALSVVVLAVAPVVLTAGSQGADLATIGVLGAQAGAAALLAYIYNLVWPQAGGMIPEAPARAGRTVVQHVLAGALVAGVGAAADVASTGDLKAMGWMAAQAVAASVLAWAHNVVKPMPKRDGETSGAEVEAAAGGGDGFAGS